MNHNNKTIHKVLYSFGGVPVADDNGIRGGIVQHHTLDGREETVTVVFLYLGLLDDARRPLSSY